MHATAATRKVRDIGLWFYINRKRLCAHYFSECHVVNLHATAATRVSHSPRPFYNLFCFYELVFGATRKLCTALQSHAQLQQLST